MSAAPDDLAGLTQLIARGLWHRTLQETETSEETAIAMTGDDWEQFLPEAEKLVPDRGERNVSDTITERDRELLALEYERGQGDGPYPTYANLARKGSGAFTLCSLRAIARARAEGFAQGAAAAEMPRETPGCPVCERDSRDAPEILS